MSTIIAGFIVMLLIVVAMSIGVIMGRKPISGSCGGLSAIGMKSACDVCGGVDKCEKEKMEKSNDEGVNDLSYDATKQK